ncbi:MAG: GNAT family N-acetyltransferase [Saprospirales bacterium]|nr:GNAT family N-acetyltransferase [Saprospirales bacterium]
MILVQTDRFILREFSLADAPSFAHLANNRKVWAGVRDAFPHPYTLENAKEFIEMVTADQPTHVFAIEIDGKAVGAIGYFVQEDVYRYSAEIGYWLGEPYWGQGLMTEVVKLMVEKTFERSNVWRLYAGVYHTNTGSQRVLEKAGFQKEGVLRKAVFKDGQVLDEVRYAFLRPDL